MKFNKLKRILLVTTSACLLASCGNEGNGSSLTSEDNGDTSISESKSEEIDLSPMIKELAKGMSVESLVTVTQDLGTKDNPQLSYGKFYLDVQSTSDHYAYQQYQEVESVSATPTKDTVSLKGNFVKSIMGYACNSYLGIDNKAYTTPLTQEGTDGTSYVMWSDSGLENIFASLDASMFQKVSENEYQLKTDTDIALKRKITANFYGENTVPAVNDFTLTVKDGHISEYYISTETQKRYNSTYYVSYTLQYEFEGKMLAYGANNEEVTKNFNDPITGEKDETLENAFASLRNHNYVEDTSVYQISDPSLDKKGTFNSRAVYTYADSVKTETIYDNKNKVTSDKAYYLTEDNFLQEVIKVGDGYYNQGLKLSNSALSNPYPAFNISSLFFEKQDNGVYLYKYGNKGCELFYSSFYTAAVSSNIYTASIDLSKENEITISSIIVQSSDNATVYYKMVSTFSGISSTTSPIDPSMVKNGDELTWDDYFAGDASLAKAKEILGKERFNSIPVLGGYYNKVDLVADEESHEVQMQYDIGNLSVYDFDGDGQVASTELLYLYSEIDNILRPYSQKIDSEMWPSLQAGLYANTFCVELSSTQNVGENEELVFSVFFTYDQYTSEAYIVISAKYNSVVTVTFDLNYEGAENIVKTINKGSKVDAEVVRRKGYTFGGWYLDKECTKSASFDNTIEENTTFYAKWNPINQ